MLKIKWLGLQLFAGEGGAGGDGATTGEASSADAGQNTMAERLLELGVPADKIRKRAKTSAPAAQTASAPAEKGETGQAAAAEATVDGSGGEDKAETPPAAARMSWDEIMQDPEYNAKMQETMQARLRKAKGAEEALSALTPALELLARKYGLDSENLDAAALSQAISDESEFYEERAIEMGVSVDVAKRLDQEERNEARKKREEAVTLEEQRIAQHIESMEQQAKALKAKYPTFDLRAELKNPVFARMTAPNSGISVEDAYFAIHRKEIQQATVAQTTAQTTRNLSRSIQAGQNRPVESGAAGQAPSTTTFNYAKATPAEKKAFKEYLRAEAAAGRKVYPGGYPGR